MHTIGQLWYLWAFFATICTYKTAFNGVKLFMVSQTTEDEIEEIYVDPLRNFIIQFSFYIAVGVAFWFLALLGVTLFIIERYQGGI